MNTPGRLRLVAWALTLMAAALGVTALRNFLSHNAVSGRIVGYEGPLTENPNDLALMLNLILPVTVALLLINRKAATRGLLIGLIVLSVSAIVVTFSRAGFLALATTLVLYMCTLLRSRQRMWAIAVVALVVVAVPVLPSGYVDRVGTIANIDADRTGSAQVRREDMLVSLKLALSRPLAGVGLGMNILALNELRGPRWQPVHNVYLEYAVDLGWPGLVLFLLLLVSCVRTVVRVRRQCAAFPELGELSVFAEAIRISLLSFAIAAFFYPVAYHFYFYYFAALAVAIGAIFEAEAPSLRASTPMLAMTTHRAMTTHGME